MVYYFWFWLLNFKKDVDSEDIGEFGSVFYKESEDRDILFGRGRVNGKENDNFYIVNKGVLM